MKKFARIHWLALFASSSALALLGLQACSGDDGSANDAGPDVTTNDVAAQDSSPDVTQNDGGGACPSYSGSVDFCKAAVARCNACGAGSVNIDQCSLSNFDAVCNWANGIFSAQYQAAFAACATQCDQDAESACNKSALADASLSAAQQKTVDDYCARCGQNQGCAAATASQLQIVEISDTIAAQVDSKCTPDAGGPDSSACGLAYLSCYGGVAQTALAGNPCADAGGD